MATASGSLLHQRKFAFVIGNSNYNRSDNRLNHSVENVKALSDCLQTIGFNVTTAYDLEKHKTTTDVIDFSKKIGNGDLVLFYYSGQTYQVEGKNYLIPVGDTQIETERDVEDFAIDFDRIIERLVAKNPSYVNIFIFDCCGKYLLQNTTTTAHSTMKSNGLAEMKLTNGAFIQFAGAANETVRNNLFTKHLLKNITQENINIIDVFRRIADDVYRESNNKQRALSINGIRQHQEVYLNKVIKPVEIPAPTILLTRDYFTEQKLSPEEESYYGECKEYYHLTKQPLISVSDEIFDNNIQLTSSSLKFGIDERCNEFDLQKFFEQLCYKLHLKMKDIVIKRVQKGSAILEAEIFDKFESNDKKLKLKMIYQSFTENLREQLGKMKIFFMFMGPIKALLKRQKYRAELKLNPQYNRIYIRGRNFWQGPLNDGKDRGSQPYYCPVGWQRCSFYVTDNFNEKFRGWCIGYHGTKFSYGLSILLSGLKPAEKAVHGAGVYLTPSINYACHPRYSEVKFIESSYRNKFFKSGQYVQYVLECRVHPNNIKWVDKETLNAKDVTIDNNIDNNMIEWVINNQNKSIVDFNDPNSSIACTGLLIRVTDNHPGLLPESQWWYSSHLCKDTACCCLGIDRHSLFTQLQNGNTCNITYD